MGIRDERYRVGAEPRLHFSNSQWPSDLTSRLWLRIMTLNLLGSEGGSDGGFVGDHAMGSCL